MRQIVLDTETTGLDPQKGHRIIEIACVELVSRRLTGKAFHYYLNPDREIDEGAVKIHGITSEFLKDKHRFNQIAADFLEFVKGSQLIIHNAPFDIGFLDCELKLADKQYGIIADHCTVFDTLVKARRLHPGQRNNLDALCKRYSVNNSHRNLHGALLDANLLSEVYLAMTMGQDQLFNQEETAVSERSSSEIQLPKTPRQGKPLKVIKATAAEWQAHQAMMEK